jgi:hypothetical protein
MWGLLFCPPIYDVVLLGYYFFYDMGSAVDIYVEDHNNGWTYWAVGQGVMAVGTIAYYIYILVARYVLNPDIFNDMTHNIIFIIVNSINLILPISKYMMIYYESGLTDGDCGFMNCFWALDTYVGEINLDVEMYPDLFKTG